jgi:hypothetical protein
MKKFLFTLVIFSLFYVPIIGYSQELISFKGKTGSQIAHTTIEIKKPSPSLDKIFKGRKEIKGYIFKLVEHPETDFFIEKDYGSKFGFGDSSFPIGVKVEISGIEMGKNYYYVKLMRKIK